MQTPRVRRSRGYTLQVGTEAGDAYSKCAQHEGMHTPMHTASGVHTKSVHRSRGYTLQMCREAGDTHSTCAQKQGIHTPSVHSRRGYTLQVCTAGRVVHSKCAQQDGRHRALEGLFAHIAPLAPPCRQAMSPKAMGGPKGNC